MENIFLEEFRKFSFTKNQKKIAKYFMDHQYDISQKTLREAAAEAGVSEVSVLNFVRKLGYSGFAEFKSKVHEQITQQLHQEAYPQHVDLNERLKSNVGSRTSNHLMDDHIRTEIYNVEESLTQNNRETYDKIVELLIQSNSIVVVGLGSVEGLANRFCRAMYHLFDNVKYLNGYYNGLVQALSRVKKGDTIIMLCFSRYYKTDVALCKMVKENGANLILISDSAISPIAVYADLLLAATTKSISFYHSMIGLLTILEYLTVLLVDRVGDDAQACWNMIDRYTEDFRC